jgi:hypothetical protein
MSGTVLRALQTGLAIVMIGCAGQKEAGQESASDPGASLRGFEADFNPSSLDPAPGTPARPARPDSIAAAAGHQGGTSAVPTETVQGFRVQVFSTTNFDEANARKAALEEAIPQERVYLDYDPPTYKIRAGNFLTRYDADRFVRFLSDKGFSGAWAVPQRVLKNPPPLPPRATDPNPPVGSPEQKAP